MTLECATLDESDHILLQFFFLNPLGALSKELNIYIKYSIAIQGQNLSTNFIITDSKCLNPSRHGRFSSIINVFNTAHISRGAVEMLCGAPAYRKIAQF